MLSTEPAYGFALDGEELIITDEYTHLFSHDLSRIVPVGTEEIIITDEWTHLFDPITRALLEV